jgi:hypothetical protein
MLLTKSEIACSILFRFYELILSLVDFYYNQKRAGCVRFVNLRPCGSGSLWMYEQAPNPQISVSTWCLAEANHRLLTKKRIFNPYKKSFVALTFKKPFGTVGLLHPHCEAVF